MTPDGLRIDALAGLAVLVGHADHLRIAAQKNVRSPRIERVTQPFFQLSTRYQVLNVNFMVFALGLPCHQGKIRVMPDSGASARLEWPDSRDRDDSARSRPTGFGRHVPAAQQFPQHVIVRRLARAGGERKLPCRSRLNRIEREMAGDLLAHEQSIAFLQHKKPRRQGRR